MLGCEIAKGADNRGYIEVALGVRFPKIVLGGVFLATWKALRQFD